LFFLSWRGRPKARLSGMGGAYLKGLNALGVNPAGLYIVQPEILTQYQHLPLDTNLALVGFAYPVRSLDTTFALSYLGLRSSNFDRRNEFGESVGSFVNQDQMVGFHMSRPLTLPFGNSPLYLGASVKMMRVQVDTYRAHGFGFDVGGQYRMSQLPVSIGISALNFGKGPTLIREASELPSRFVASMAYHVSEPMVLLGSFSRSVHEGKSEVSMGIQRWMGDILVLRGRYAFLSGVEGSKNSGFENFTAGIGLKMLKSHTLDYTFQPFDSALREAGALGTHRITLTFRFGKLKRERKGEL